MAEGLLPEGRIPEAMLPLCHLDKKERHHRRIEVPGHLEATKAFPFEFQGGSVPGASGRAVNDLVKVPL